MQLEQLELTGGGTLTLYLRESVEAMLHFRQRPLVLVVPGGGSLVIFIFYSPVNESFISGFNI